MAGILSRCEIILTIHKAVAAASREGSCQTFLTSSIISEAPRDRDVDRRAAIHELYAGEASGFEQGRENTEKAENQQLQSSLIFPRNGMLI
jgi:hypothetical protein